MNVNKLKGEIVSRGMSVADLADKLGINTATMYRKLSNNGDTMLIRDANRIVEVLNLSADEAISIFFSPVVA